MFALICFFIFFFLIYLCLCVPNSKDSFLGIIKVFLTNIIEQLYSKLPKSLQSILYSLYDYIANKPNPIVQILYLILVAGIFIFYYKFGILVFYPNKKVPYYTIYIIYILVILSLYSFYLSCKKGPGIINKKNYKILKLKYNIPTLYGEDKFECKKCGIPKIPRSKHCIICNLCIEKFDHHCIWVNQCIGAKNYRFFLSFLFLHFILTTYSSSLGFYLIYNYTVEKKLFKAHFYNPITNEEVNSSLKIIFQYLLSNFYAFIATNIMLIVISITLFAFICFHLNLIRLNFTNSERNKQVKTIRYLNLIKDTLKNISEKKKFKLEIKELSAEEIKKYKRICFCEPEFDLDSLDENELNTFYNFTLQSIIIFRKNPYYKGFKNAFKDMIFGI